jgi:hypothetical protein
MTIFSNEVLPGSEWNTQIKKDKYSTRKNQSKIKLLHNFKCRSHFSFAKKNKTQKETKIKNPWLGNMFILI